MKTNLPNCISVILQLSSTFLLLLFVCSVIVLQGSVCREQDFIVDDTTLFRVVFYFLVIFTEQLLDVYKRQVWLPGRRFDVGNPGPPLGLGEDQGMEVFQKT